MCIFSSSLLYPQSANQVIKKLQHKFNLLVILPRIFRKAILAHKDRIKEKHPENLLTKGKINLLLILKTKPSYQMGRQSGIVTNASTELL